MALTASSMLSATKLALRITTTAFDSEITDLLNAAIMDLGVAGVEIGDGDALVKTACITYVRVHFGTPDDFERLKKSYDEQKAQLSMNTGHTIWGISNGQE